MPEALDKCAQVLKPPGIHLGGAFTEVSPVHRRPVDQVGLAKPIGVHVIDNAGFGQGLQKTDIVGPTGQFRMGGGMPQHQVLNDEFNINQGTGVFLDVELARFDRQPIFTHAFTHVTHLGFQPLGIPGKTQHPAADGRKGIQQGGVAGNGPGPDQRLMFPGPGFFHLIAVVPVDMAHQNAGRTVGAQTHVGFVKRAGGGVGGQHVYHALTQAGKEMRVVDGLPTTDGFAAVGGVQKDEVEVRGIAQLEPAQFTVADNGESLVTGLSVQRTGGAAVPGDQVGPTDIDHGFENGFGNPGQMVADLHQGQDAGDVRGSDPQGIDLAKDAQRFHLVFGIAVGYTGQLVRQAGLQGSSVGRCIEGARIEQFVQQNRMAAEKGGDPGAGAHQADQMRQGGRILDQKGEIADALLDLFEQLKYALEHRFRFIAFDGRLQDPRDQTVQAPLAGTAHGPGAGFGHEAFQEMGGGGAFRESGLLQELAAFGRGQRCGPGIGQSGNDGRTGVGGRRRLDRQKTRKMGGDLVAMAIENGEIGIPGEKSHGPGQFEASQGIGGQRVGLLVTGFLKAMFAVAQETIGLDQLPADRRWYVPFAGEHRQHGLDGRLLQGGQYAATDQLEHLTEKLDFADAAAAQLDIVIQSLAADFGANFLFHFAQGFKDPEIEIATENERPQAIQELLTGGGVAGDDLGLDQGIPFPFTSLGLVVVFHVIEGHHQGAAVTKRPQACIDPEDEALRRAVADGLDQKPAEAGEKCLVGQGPRSTAGLAGAWEGEDQVHIRAEIQFTGPQFAHAQDHQPLGIAGIVPGGADRLAQAVIQNRQGTVDGRLGQGGQIGHGFIQAAEPGQIAYGNADHFATAEVPQGRLQRYQPLLGRFFRRGRGHGLEP
ncbi:hypothetical protein DESC_760008 [Desulfosarcina cetonica]|nr:hypothetical protein DESC_760008 [Desulfosarcina cetonica]